MSATLDRLRRLQRLRPRQSESLPQTEMPAPATSAGTPGGLDQLVPGREVENDAGRCYVVEERLPETALRGIYRLGDLLSRSVGPLAKLYPGASSARECDFSKTIFVDTETTGLGGGAGVYAFMVGVGVFEEGAKGREFVVRQIFMRHPGEELALLHELDRQISEQTGVVSFNGRTFDLPLLRNRFRLNRLSLPLLLSEDAPHLDLLHPARRLWRKRLSSCALSALESAIIGHRRSEEDVSGHLIPYLYADFLQHGDAGELRRVFYHNFEDIVSMVVLAERICLHFTSPLELAEQGEIEALDLFCLGRLYDEGGKHDEAERCYRTVLSHFAPSFEQCDVFEALGRLLKRQERWEEALELWQLWLSSVPDFDPRPCEELAKYWEWRGRNLAEAEMWTAWALHGLQSVPVGQRNRSLIAAFEHRLQRIQKKKGRPGG